MIDAGTTVRWPPHGGGAWLGSGSVVAAGRFIAGVHCDLADLPADAEQRLLAALADGLAAR
jgi:hypothetical protein